MGYREHFDENLLTWLTDFDGEQARPNKRNAHDPQHWSLVLFFFGTGFFVLRRLNVWEWVKHLVPRLTPKRNTPAKATDIYLFALWSVWFLVGVTGGATAYPFWISIAAGWCILQTMQALFWHNIWRSTCLESDDRRNVTLNYVRTLIIGMSSLLAVIWWFAIIYHANSTEFFGLDETNRPRISSFSDCLYFSVETAATVGYGDIVPQAGSGARTVVAIQMFCSFLMVVVIIANNIGVLRKLPEPEEKMDH